MAPMVTRSRSAKLLGTNRRYSMASRWKWRLKLRCPSHWSGTAQLRNRLLPHHQQDRSDQNQADAKAYPYSGCAPSEAEGQQHTQRQAGETIEAQVAYHRRTRIAG